MVLHQELAVEVPQTMVVESITEVSRPVVSELIVEIPMVSIVKRVDLSELMLRHGHIVSRLLDLQDQEGGIEDDSVVAEIAALHAEKVCLAEQLRVMWRHFDGQ